MKNKIILTLLIILSITTTAFAHPGKTDKNGGHHDYNNISGLGYYHYHCGGHPAHLHPNGVCPYDTNTQTKTEYFSLSLHKLEYKENTTIQLINLTIENTIFNTN